MKRKVSRANRGYVAYAVDGAMGRPCTNAKFMHIAGLPGVNSKTSFDVHDYEEITSLYKGEELIAERIMGCVAFPGEKVTVNCFLFGYNKDIENAEMAS